MTSPARRLRWRAARAARRVLGDASGPASATPAAPPPPGATARFGRSLQPARLAADGPSVVDVLYERLDADDIRETEAQIAKDAELGPYYASAPDDGIRRTYLLAFGVALACERLLERTGLSAAQPPQDIHSMARGPLAAAGGLYEADLVVNGLASAGVDIATVGAALDFGCSSGRVLRVLAPAYPQVRWHGCDPNGPAIEWASQALGGIDFFQSPDAPPLPLTDAQLDLVYAISIWSHFEPQLGLRWFEEMRRLIRPGGHLIATTHGLTTVAHDTRSGARTAQQADEIVGALYESGTWYAAEFGEVGDWGVVNPSWGTAFLSPEWLLTQLTPQWRVLEYAPGRNQENQDIYVLQRA